VTDQGSDDPGVTIETEVPTKSLPLAVQIRAPSKARVWGSLPMFATTVTSPAGWAGSIM
jgi:hypothetical protein